jgi:hypothetical protein
MLAEKMTDINSSTVVNRVESVHRTMSALTPLQIGRERDASVYAAGPLLFMSMEDRTKHFAKQYNNVYLDFFGMNPEFYDVSNFAERYPAITHMRQMADSLNLPYRNYLQRSFKAFGRQKDYVKLASPHGSFCGRLPGNKSPTATFNFHTNEEKLGYWREYFVGPDLPAIFFRDNDLGFLQQQYYRTWACWRLRHYRLNGSDLEYFCFTYPVLETRELLSSVRPEWKEDTKSDFASWVATNRGAIKKAAAPPLPSEPQLPSCFGWREIGKSRRMPSVYMQTACSGCPVDKTCDLASRQIYECHKTKIDDVPGEKGPGKIDVLALGRTRKVVRKPVA